MTRINRPRIQYNPVFRDSSSNHPFEDIFLYDADKTNINYSVQQSIDRADISHQDNNENNGCFYSFNKIIIKILSYFIDSK
jgi:hypothetical protein